MLCSCLRFPVRSDCRVRAMQSVHHPGMFAMKRWYRQRRHTIETNPIDSTLDLSKPKPEKWKSLSHSTNTILNVFKPVQLVRICNLSQRQEHCARNSNTMANDCNLLRQHQRWAAHRPNAANVAVALSHLLCSIRLDHHYLKWFIVALDDTKYRSAVVHLLIVWNTVLTRSCSMNCDHWTSATLRSASTKPSTVATSSSMAFGSGRVWLKNSSLTFFGCGNCASI